MFKPQQYCCGYFYLYDKGEKYAFSVRILDLFSIYFARNRLL